MTDSTATAPSSYLDPADVARELGLSEKTIRNAIREECAAHMPDWERFVPGGRVFNSNIKIVRAIYEKARSGELTSTSREPEEPRERLKLEIVGTWVPVDEPSRTGAAVKRHLALVSDAS